MTTYARKDEPTLRLNDREVVILVQESSANLVEVSPPQLPETRLPATVPSTQPAASAPDPEFDAYMAIVKLLIGGTVEGTAQLLVRLQAIEDEIRAQEEDSAIGEVNTTADVLRFALVGFALSASDTARSSVLRWTEASDMFWRVTGSAIDPLTENRFTGFFTGPFERAFERLNQRGEEKVAAWVELGRQQEPSSRKMARLAYLRIVDEFIEHLAANEELAELVQEQSVSLAAEAVDSMRSRTVSADTLAERMVRRMLRRPPRAELPPPPDEVRKAAQEILVYQGDNPAF
jgi:hypothetical protein